MNNLRFAVRQLRKAPAFTVTALATVAICLGANQRGQIGSQFLSLGLRLLAAGTIFGLFGAWLTGRAMQSVLFDVPTLPFATLLGTALVMTAVSLVACLIPARRAGRIDPIIALRSE